MIIWENVDRIVVPYKCRDDDDKRKSIEFMNDGYIPKMNWPGKRMIVLKGDEFRFYKWRER